MVLYMATFAKPSLPLFLSPFILSLPPYSFSYYAGFDLFSIWSKLIHSIWGK